MNNLAYKLEFIEESHIYLVDGRKRVSTTTLLKQNGLYGNILQFATDEHLWRGKAIHEAMEYYNKGTLDWSKLDPAIRPYISAFELFQKEKGFIPRGWELHLWHPVLDYTGTPDVWGDVGPEIWVMDYKSGVVPRGTGVQLAAYKSLLIVNDLIPKDKIIRRVGIQLKSDGDYKLTPFNDPVDENIWQMIISINNWRNANA